MIKLQFNKIWQVGLSIFAFLFFSLIGAGFYSFHSTMDDKEILSSGSETHALSKTEVITQFFKAPLCFECNEGQTDAQVKYLTKRPGYTFYFTPQEMVMVLQGKESAFSTLRMQFIGANPNLMIKGMEETKCKSNYFIGNDPQKWHTNISNYAKVCYQEMYPGIDVLFYGNNERLEYDICVAPSKNPQTARLKIEGAKELSIDQEGTLHILTDEKTDVQMQKPCVYQVIEGNKIAIDGHFTLLAQNEVGFSIGVYDSSQWLVIDPVLDYSTYLGSNFDVGFGIAIDSSGNAYVTGQTNSINFPTTAGAFQTSLNGSQNAFITKLNPAGRGASDLLYSTYLGGNSFDMGSGVAIDSDGNAYVAGSTQSTNFPTTIGAFQTTLTGNQNAFISKLNLAGGGASDLLYSTYLGGNDTDSGNGIAIDSSGHAYVTGYTESTNFPTTISAFQTTLAGNQNAFISKLNLAGGGASDLLYSTYLGGNNLDFGIGVAIDSGGHAYVTGYTRSTNFPTTIGAFQTTLAGSQNAFISKLNLAGGGASDLLYSTYLGGNDTDSGNGIAIDSSGHAYITGQTRSTNFPTTIGAFQTTLAGNQNAFISKLNLAGGGLSDLLYSTYLGGNNLDFGIGVAIDSGGHAYITGYTRSTNFPTTIGAFQTTLAGNQNAFISKLNLAGGGLSDLLYSTYLGGNGTDSGNGIVVDSSGHAYVAGFTQSINFPTTIGAFQTTLTGIQNAFISKFAIGTPIVSSISPSNGPITGGTTVTVTGINFTNATAVYFGGIAASFSIVSDTQITAISPSHAAGAVDITVAALGGTSAETLNDMFTYVLTPSQTATTTSLTVTPNPSVLGQSVSLTATIVPVSAIGSVEFFDGGTLLATIPVSNGTAVLRTSFFTVGSHTLTAVYSGDTNFSGSTSSPVILNVTSNLFPPTHLQGFQTTNRFATQTDIINILKWKTPLQSSNISAYRIYRNHSLTKLIAEIPADKKLQFEDHNRKKGKAYTYYIVSVDQLGNLSASVKLKIQK